MTGRSIRLGVVRNSLGFLVAAISLIVIAGVWWFFGRADDSSLSLDEQNLFRLPNSNTQTSSNVAEKGSEGKSNSWDLPSEPIEITTSVLLKECTQLADQLVLQFPENVEANYIAARVYYFLHQPEKAEPFWRKCLQIGPPLVGYYAGLALTLEDRGQPEEIKALMESAHASGHRSEQTVLSYAKALEALGDTELAYQEATKGLESYSDSHELWQISGQFLNQLNRFEESEVAFRKSLELGGSSERILPALVMSLARQKKQQEAAELRKQFANENLTSSKQGNREENYQRYYDANLRELGIAVFQTAARIFAQNRKANEYRSALQRCLELNPKDTEAIMAFAELAKSGQQPEQAIKLYQQAIQVNPEDVGLYLGLSTLAMQMGDKTLAESTLLRAVELPKGFVAKHSLAQMYLVQGRQIEALKLAEQVIEKDPSVDAYLLHAVVCNAMGKMELAKNSLEKAKGIAPDDARIQSMAIPKP